MSLRQLRFCVVGRVVGNATIQERVVLEIILFFFFVYISVNFSSNSTEYHLKFYQQFNTVAAASDQPHLYMIFFSIINFILCAQFIHLHRITANAK